MKKILLVFASCLMFFSCSKNKGKDEGAFNNLETVKSHVWYAFNEAGFEKIDLPQNAKVVTEKPWTETVRISSAGSVVPSRTGSLKGPYDAYALVNKRGLLAFSDSKIDFFRDDSIFVNDTADSIVFSGGMPVFYLFRSTFFNENLEAHSSLHQSRPFLVEFNPSSKVFYPLVSYSNLKLGDDDQISGFFWNGDTWACASKKMNGSGVEFSFFDWKPLVALADLNPAMGQETFLFNSITEDEYKNKNMPKLWAAAPDELKKLLSSIPEEYSFYVSWRDFSGTSPVSYCQMGASDFMLNAHGGVSPESGLSVAVFSDGTTYVKKLSDETVSCAFRLPLLPSGFSYGEEAVSGNTLYVAWEETSFFKTGRAGFIAVDLKAVIN
ncbi:hypothetical protein [Treponema sp.]|uniref:hypothetical protein n=1 Tax=Treponema sp. TaxID=166 RepID=UPI00298DF2F6|nr:hypothetical protein [Treponema sp.]MCQ2240802.1 hypothetical protein [Treponema sp.]